MTLDAIVAFHTIISLFIPLVALKTSRPVMREERLWNLCVLQRVNLSSLVSQEGKSMDLLLVTAPQTLKVILDVLYFVVLLPVPIGVLSFSGKFSVLFLTKKQCYDSDEFNIEVSYCIV
jgi:hypothetical protein